MNLKFLAKPLSLLGIFSSIGWAVYVITTTQNNELRLNFILTGIIFAALCIASSLILNKKPPSPDTDLVVFRKNKKIIAGVLMFTALLVATSMLVIFFVIKENNGF